MNMTIFIIMLFTLQGIYWLVGRRASKNISGKEDYFLAGKNVRFFPLMMTFFATQVGGGAVLGAADNAYQVGWTALFYSLGMALGFILLGSGIGRRLAGFQVTTVVEILEVVYKSVALKRVASMLSVISLFMIFVAQIIGSSKFLVSLGFSNTPLFILFWGSVIFYTAKGGLKAVISIDVAQALFFSFVLFLCFGWVFYGDPSTLSFAWPRMENFAEVSLNLCGWLSMPLFFVVIEQDMGQRCFAGASSQIVSRAAIGAGICTGLIGIVPVFFGLLAKKMGLEVPQGGSVLMTAISATTNPWMTALLGCAVLAAIISTSTSLINAISSNLSSDFKLPVLRGISNVRMVQGITCVIAMAAIFIAFYFDNIVGMLIQSYELSVSCLFIPIFLALFRKDGNFLSALLSMVLGAMGFFLFRIYSMEFPKEIASILLSLCGYVCGELVSYYLK